MKASIRSVAACVALGSGFCAHAEEQKTIKDFLMDLGSGPVSAADLIGLSGSAVTTIQSPKDFVAALGSSTSETAKAGFGLSIAPARTSFSSMSIAEYSKQENYLARLWGGTTLSYAQNKADAAGASFKQSAVAIHVSTYLDAKDDPVAAAWTAFAGCEKVRHALVEDAGSANQEVQRQLDAAKAAGRTLNQTQMDEITGNIRKSADYREKVAEATKAARTCATQGADDAKSHWNAAQLAFTYGTGWVRADAAGSVQFSLGRVLSADAAIGVGSQGLLNLSLRRTSRAPDLSTLATTPDYKTSNLAGVRYTYGAGPSSGLYGIAEASNAKASTSSTSNAVFKYALGVDKKMAEGMWIEFRFGRNRTSDGTSEQTTGLFNLKVSPSATLPQTIASMGQ
jgi:hypothetical protein